MNSISFHNAIISLLKGVLDDEHEEVKLIPNESVSGGAPAIEAIEDVFKGGAESLQANDSRLQNEDHSSRRDNDRYIDEAIDDDEQADAQNGGIGESHREKQMTLGIEANQYNEQADAQNDGVEIDDPDDIMNGGAFDDSASDEEAEDEAHQNDKKSKDKKAESEAEDEVHQANDENPANEPEHEELDANELEDKPKDDEGSLIDENDSDEHDEHDSEDAIDGTGADNKEPEKIEIPDEAKDKELEAEIEKEVEEAKEEAKDSNLEPSIAVTEEESSKEEKEESDLMLSGGTMDIHRVIVITADTKFPYVLRQKHKK